MIPYTQTKMFGDLLSKMDAEIVRLENEQDRLARTIAEKQLANVSLSKSKKKATLANEKSLVRVQESLISLRAKKLKHAPGNPVCIEEMTWSSVTALLAACRDDDPKTGGLFRFDEDVTAGKNVNYEGQGEREVRARLGLENKPSLEHNDTPFGEVKFTDNGTIRIGQFGMTCWSETFEEIVHKWKRPSSLLAKRGLSRLPKEVWQHLRACRISSERLKGDCQFPIELCDLIKKRLTPQKVICYYDVGIFITDRRGYFHVPVCDYPNAFVFICATKMSPKYRLSREYVEAQIMKTFASDQTTIAV